MIDFEAKAREIVRDHVRHIEHLGATFDDAGDGLAPAITAALREAHAAGMNMAASMADPYMTVFGRGEYLAEVLEFTSVK